FVGLTILPTLTFVRLIRIQKERMRRTISLNKWFVNLIGFIVVVEVGTDMATREEIIEAIELGLRIRQISIKEDWHDDPNKRGKTLKVHCSDMWGTDADISPHIRTMNC